MTGRGADTDDEVFRPCFPSTFVTFRYLVQVLRPSGRLSTKPFSHIAIHGRPKPGNRLPF